MNVERANKIIDGYVSWWRNSVETYQDGNAVRIVCPMLDRHNDFMSVYLVEDGNGFILTDMGATIADLSASGCDVMTDARKPKLSCTLAGYGVSEQDGELYIRAGEDDLFSSMNMLMQSMASVDDLYYTMRDSARQYITEEIASWMDDNNIRYSRDINIIGRSGFEANFDFLIPGSKREDVPERYIKAVGSPSESSVKNALFGWEDIIKARGESVSYLFMDVNGSSNKSVNPKLIRACDSYGVRPVAWSGSADNLIPELAA